MTRISKAAVVVVMGLVLTTTTGCSERGGSPAKENGPLSVRADEGSTSLYRPAGAGRGWRANFAIPLCLEGSQGEAQIRDVAYPESDATSVASWLHVVPDDEVRQPSAGFVTLVGPIRQATEKYGGTLDRFNGSKVRTSCRAQGPGYSELIASFPVTEKGATLRGVRITYEVDKTLYVAKSGWTMIACGTDQPPEDCVLPKPP